MAEESTCVFLSASRRSMTSTTSGFASLSIWKTLPAFCAAVFFT